MTSPVLIQNVWIMIQNIEIVTDDYVIFYDVSLLSLMSR